MSASSNVNRRRVMRSRPVVVVADRMFTWWSERTVAMSESSRVRSSASTWIATTNDVDFPSLHATSIIRSGSRRSAFTFGTVLAVHRDALPAGDEPDDRVAGHGRAAAAELHPDVGQALAP